MATELTAFQANATDKIRHLGGSIYFREDRSFRDGHGARVPVPARDFKTEGFVGWPTVKALVEARVLRPESDGNKYTLT